MAEFKDTLISLLRKPYEVDDDSVDTSVWQYREATKDWIHTTTGYVEALPRTTSVRGMADFAEMVTFDDKRYSLFVATMYASIETIDESIASRQKKDRLRQLLNETLLEVQKKRNDINKVRSVVSPADSYAVDRALSRNVYGEDIHTTIGPCKLDNGIPITEVLVLENYKVETMQSLMGISDPSYKSTKADVTIAITLSVDYGRLNDTIGPDGKITKYGLKSILATLKVAPICEIYSTALIPVFINSLIAQEQNPIAYNINEELKRQGRPGREQRYNQLLTEIKSNTAKVIDRQNSKVPPNAPRTTAGLVEVQVLRIIDGDTIQVSSDPSLVLTTDTEYHIRLLGINTPETAKPNATPPKEGEPGGEEATAHLASLLPVSSTIYLEADQDTVDAYRRSLRYIYKKDSSGQLVMVNLAMLQSGHAKPLSIEPNTKYKSTFVKEAAMSTDKDVSKFIKLLQEKSGLLDFISGTSEEKAPARSIPEKVKGVASIACAFKGYLAEKSNRENKLYVKLFFNKYDDTNLQRGKILYRDADGNPTTEVTNCPWIEKLASLVMMAPKGPMANHYEGSIKFRWRSQDDTVLNEWDPDERYVGLDLMEARSFMKMVSLPTLSSPYGIAQYMGIDNHRVKLVLRVNDSLSLAKLHEMKADLDKVSFQEFILGPRLDAVTIIEPTLNFLGASEFIIASIATERLDGIGKWTVEMTLVESKIRAKDTEQLYLTNKGNAEEKDLKFVWDYLWSVLAGDGDQKDYPVVSQLLFDLEKNGVYSIIDPNIMWAVWLFQHQKKKDPSRIKLNPNSGLEMGEDWVEALDDYFYKEGFPYDPFIHLSPNILDNRWLTEVKKDISHRRGFITNNKDWAQKIHDESANSGNTFESIISTPSLSEIRNDGRDLLYNIGMFNRNVSPDNRIVFTKEFWNDYFSIVVGNKITRDTSKNPVWTVNEIDKARANIFGLIASGIFNDLEGLDRSKLTFNKDTTQDTVVSGLSHDVKAKTASNHAYLNMPSYLDMFGNNKELFAKFAPTYSDLGKKPPLRSVATFRDVMSAANRPARKLNDPIEPSFYLYHEKIKPTIIDKDIKEAERYSKILNSINIISIPSKYKKEPAAAIGRYINDVFNPPGQVSTDDAMGKETERQKLKALKDNQVINIFSEEGTRVGTAKKNNNVIEFTDLRGRNEISVNALGDYSHSLVDAKENLALTKELMLRTPDMGLNPARVFPAYRLYFIEPDSGYEVATDDLYGVNSVISMEIRLDKYDTAVLRATLANATNNLGEDTIISDETRQKLGIGQDEDAEIYSRIKVQAGTLVKVLLGYGTMPSDLECVFTGMITDVMPGRALEIVAQCHKRELTNEIQFALDSTNHFDIIRRCLEKSETPNLGQAVSFKATSNKTLRDLFPDAVNYRDYLDAYDKHFNKKLVNMKNINIVSNGSLDGARRAWTSDTSFGSGSAIDTTWKTVVGIADYTVGDVFATPWYVPPQTAWDAIQEVTRHRPETIAQVVPFGNGGTLFIGHPDQPYYAEQPDYEEVKIYNKFKAEAVAEKSKDLLDILRDFERAYKPDSMIKLVRSYLGRLDIEDFPVDTRIDFGTIIAGVNQDRIKVGLGYLDDAGIRKLIQDELGDATPTIDILKDKGIDIFELFIAKFRLDRGNLKIVPALDKLVNDMFKNNTSKILKAASTRLAYEDADNIEVETKLMLSSNQDIFEGITQLPLEDKLNKYISRHILGFRYYAKNLAEYLNKDENKDKKLKNPSSTDPFLLPPGYRPFREYHYISTKDIIDNQIYASMQDMSNCILVRAPATPASFGTTVDADVDSQGNDEGQETVTIDNDDTEWTSYPSTDGVPFNYKVAKENRKLGVVAELNANTANQKGYVLMTNMGKLIQPMYRGKLLVVGRVIKPYDVVYIRDGFNDMKGYFEVAAVTQMFSVETGWITEIEPHALVRVNNATSELQMIAMNGWLRAGSAVAKGVNNVLDILTIIGLLSSFFTGGASGAAAAGLQGLKTSVAGVAIKNYVKSNIKPGVLTAGRLLSRPGGYLGSKALTLAELAATPKGIFVVSPVLFLLNELLDTLTSVFVKCQYESTTLPIDVQLLMYKGVPFQTGLSSANDDIFYNHDKFVQGMNTFRQQMADFFEDIIRDVANESGYDPYELARRTKE